MKFRVPSRDCTGVTYGSTEYPTNSRGVVEINNPIIAGQFKKAGLEKAVYLGGCLHETVDEIYQRMIERGVISASGHS